MPPPHSPSSRLLFERVRRSWEVEGKPAPAGASSRDIAAFEATYGLRLPDSFAGFYRCTDGNEAAGPHLFNCWPLALVGTVPAVLTPYQGVPDYGRISDVLPDAADYFVFGDVMIWSHVLAVRLRPSGVTSAVVWICGSTWEPVAPTFEEFWEGYLERADEMLLSAGAR